MCSTGFQAVITLSHLGIAIYVLKAVHHRTRIPEDLIMGAEDDKPSSKCASLDSRIQDDAQELESETSSPAKETVDENVVFWDSPNDPANPRNWSFKKKGVNIAVLSVLTFLTPLASSMFAPGVPELMREFGSDKYVAVLH